MMNKTSERIYSLWLTQFVGLLLAVCFVGLTHDADYLRFTTEAGMEQGEGMDARVAFDKNINRSPLYRRAAFLGVAMLAAGMSLIPVKKNRLEVSKLAVFAVVIIGVVYGSLLWSENPSKTARELFRISVFAFTGLVFAIRFSRQDICQIIGTVLAISVAFACLAEIVSGNFDVMNLDYRLGGTLHTNTLANQAAVLAVLCYAFQLTSRYRGVLLGIVLASFAVILLSRTRGAIATALVGIAASHALYAWHTNRSARLKIAALAIVTTTFAVLVVALLIASPTLRDIALLGRTDEAVTLTGRIPLWELLWDESSGKRLLGHGYGAFWKEANLEIINEELQWYANHAHSAYMHTIIDVGFLGLILFLGFAVTCMAKAKNLLEVTGHASSYFFFAFFAAGFVDGLLEVNFIYPRGLGLFTMMIVASLLGESSPIDSDDEASGDEETDQSVDVDLVSVSTG